MANVSDFVIPRFHPVLGDVMAHGHTHYWLHGGRGSTKSSFISICIILLIVTFPKANAVVVRRFGNTLRDSVYQQILWAIEALGLESVFRARVSPMEITYTPTGQRIVFRGADDPLKLKGVKFTKGFCSLIWFDIPTSVYRTIFRYLRNTDVLTSDPCASPLLRHAGLLSCPTVPQAWDPPASNKRAWRVMSAFLTIWPPMQTRRRRSNGDIG